MKENHTVYQKDRTERVDDYFPCRLKNCKLEHVRNWLNLFVKFHNKELETVKGPELFLHKKDIYVMF